MKRFTIGITTHNEESSISNLLTVLETIDKNSVDILLFDDFSTDQTKEIVLGHPIAKNSNFRSHFAPVNNGTPSVGRTYIGHHSQTEYVALIDGDDHVEPREFSKLTRVAPSGYDLILTPYSLRGKRIGLSDFGSIELGTMSVNRILSGIGGKVYSRRLLKAHGRDDVRGRSDDVRLNMRIVLSGCRKIFNLPDVCFYQIQASRKSMLASSLNFDELQMRVEAYDVLKRAYPVGDGYLQSLEKQIRMIVKKDPSLTGDDAVEMSGRIDAIFGNRGQRQQDEVKQEKFEPNDAVDWLSKLETVKNNPDLVAMEAEIRRFEQRRSR